MNCVPESVSVCTGSATKPAAPVDPWGLPASAVSVSPVKNSDPWGSSSAPAVADPWGSGPATRPKAPGPGTHTLSHITPYVEQCGEGIEGSYSCLKEYNVLYFQTGSFDLFSTTNGTSRDDLEDFDSLRSSMMSGICLITLFCEHLLLLLLSFEPCNLDLLLCSF